MPLLVDNKFSGHILEIFFFCRKARRPRVWYGTVRYRYGISCEPADLQHQVFQIHEEVSVLQPFLLETAGKFDLFRITCRMTFRN
jgi:hypothetical protein